MTSRNDALPVAAPAPSPAERPGRAPLRILVVVTRMDVGGVPEHILILAEHLAPLHRVTVACREVIPAHRERLERAGAKIKLIHFARLPNPLRDARALAQLWRFIRQERFDVVHSHMSKGALLGGLAARLAGGAAVLTTAHNFGALALPNALLRGLFRLYDRTLFRLTLDRLVTVSRLQADQVVAQGLLDRSRVVTVWNGIDPAKLRRRAAEGPSRAELGIPEDALVVTTVARLVWFKGIGVLVDAVERLGPAAEGVRFLVVGDGDQRARLQARIDEKGLGDRITLMGEQMRVPGLLALSDVFALPSLSEGMPIAIMEAMAFGLPVVATAVDGTPELVVDEETGILVPPRDVDLFAAGLRRLLGDVELRQRLGREGSRRIEATFSDQAMAAATDALYRSVARPAARTVARAAAA